MKNEITSPISASSAGNIVSRNQTHRRAETQSRGNKLVKDPSLRDIVETTDSEQDGCHDTLESAVDPVQADDKPTENSLDLRI